MESACCISLLEQAEDSSQTSFSDIDLLPPSNGTPTPARCSENEQPMDGFQTCTCTRETSGCSIHPNTPEEWIASQAASLAKMCQSLGVEKDLMGSALDYGLNSPAFFALFDPDSHSLKTAQRSLLADSTECCQTLPRWGSMRSGRLYLRPKPELRMNANGFGFLPTLRATDGERGGRGDLIQAIRGNRNRHFRAPTLTVCGNYNRKGASKNSGDGLATFIKYFDTSNNGPLSPNWLEWFMGFPIRWTERAVSAMRKSRSKRRSRGESLSGD